MERDGKRKRKKEKDEEEREEAEKSNTGEGRARRVKAKPSMMFVGVHRISGSLFGPHGNSCIVCANCSMKGAGDSDGDGDGDGDGDDDGASDGTSGGYHSRVSSKSAQPVGQLFNELRFSSLRRGGKLRGAWSEPS
ncbi:hypothetical protein HZH66_003215 [Vespula vulgaris]|uniref:Uncharacterized protein n=1 Tax=Vespula vulgaris TaxID=7454 RepID=A0A834NIG9_VESVU|nr:hypothetical protein HZH66_003215 [Vespula vulgaris]